MLSRVFICALFFLSAQNLAAQQSDAAQSDTSYYEKYHDDFITRVYTSRKYNFFELKNPGADRLQYRPNTMVNLGFGLTYRNLSINLGFGLKLVNPETGKGKTSKLDLQTRLYGRNWLIDLSGEFFSGYYLYPKGKDAPGAQAYYTRPDMNVDVAGISAYRIFNPGQITFQHGISHGERQKRSARSFLAGGSLHYSSMGGDSALIPLNAQRDLSVKYPLEVRSWIGSAGIGYAHTLVLPGHLFVSGAVTAQLDVGFVKESYDAMSNNKVSFRPAMSHKLAAGYFDGNWSLGAFWVNNRLAVQGYSGSRYLLNTGIVRIALTKRFTPSIRMKKRLAPIDKVIRYVTGM